MPDLYVIRTESTGALPAPVSRSAPMPDLYVIRTESTPTRRSVPRRHRGTGLPRRCVRCGAIGFGLVADRTGRFRCGPELPCTTDAVGTDAQPAAA